MNIKNKIEILFEEKIELTANTIASELNISNQYVHRILNQLVESNKIERIGRPPKTIYRIKDVTIPNNLVNGIISKEKQIFLEENFLLITELGQMLKGLEAFENWCQKRK